MKTQEITVLTAIEKAFDSLKHEDEVFKKIVDLDKRLEPRNWTVFHNAKLDHTVIECGDRTARHKAWTTHTDHDTAKAICEMRNLIGVIVDSKTKDN